MDEVSRRAEGAAASVDAMRAQTDAARAQEKGARTMLAYTHLLAPFAGVVTARMADPGTMAAPGVPLLQVTRQGRCNCKQRWTSRSSARSTRGSRCRLQSMPGHRQAPGLWPRSSRLPTHPVTVFSSRSTCPRRANARGHVCNGGVRQWRTAGDPHSALRCGRARLAQLRVCSRRPGDCAIPLPHSRRAAGRSRRSAVRRLRR